MKKTLIVLLGVVIPFLSSCIKDEPLNREADIVEITVDDPTFIDKSISENNNIELIFAAEADLTNIAPILTLSPDATVTPASGTRINLSYGKTAEYTVTSQNGEFQKKYIVRVGELKMKYGFEEWEMAGTKAYPYPILSDPEWSNANSGIVSALMFGSIDKKTFERYPTKDTTLCVNGQYAASLQTIKGGVVLGRKMPILAGNLFIGSFSGSLSSPLKSLKLGRNHPMWQGKPTYFKGYYKYTPGPEMIGPDGPLPGRTDEMSMYAAIFRVAEGTALKDIPLDGETILTSERVVARAEWKPGIAEHEVANGFREFSIPFVYNQTLDYDKYTYQITIVCSSSKDGNLWEGAIGSSLLVDDLEIVCEPIEQKETKKPE